MSVETDLLIVQVPRSMKTSSLWDPRLAYELAAAKDLGAVTLVDWNLSKWRIDTVVEGIRQFKARDLLIWVPHMQALARGLELQKRIGGWIAGVSQRDDILWTAWVGENGVRELPKPDLSAIDTDLYWQTLSAVPTAESLMWKQRVPLQFRFPAGTLKPADALRHILHLKVVWGFDSAEWRDDLTENPVWTMKLLRLLQDMDVRFQFSARLDPARLDQGYLQRLKDAGLRIADLGRIPLGTYHTPEFERLEAALMACQKLGVAATYTNVFDPPIDAHPGFLGSQDAAKDHAKKCAVKAIETALRFNIIPRVDVDPPWDKMSLDDIREADTRGFYNPWGAWNLEFVGTVAALQQLNLAAFE